MPQSTVVSEVLDSFVARVEQENRIPSAAVEAIRLAVSTNELSNLKTIKEVTACVAEAT